MNQHDFDVVIIGAGMIGLAIAKDLADSHLNIGIIDSQFIDQPLSDALGLRASAINHSSEHYFNSLNIWSTIQKGKRLYTYSDIKVKEKNRTTQLNATGKELDFKNLGYIIENHYIQTILMDSLKHYSTVSFISDTVSDVQINDERAFIYLQSQKAISTKLLIAADGANSFIRQQLNTPLIQKPYKHHAIVATIKTSFKHDSSAKQLFYPEGIVAFLPLWKEHHHCLVWSTLPENASKLSKLPEAEFNATLSQLTDYWEGECELASKPVVFPLITRYTPKFVQNRVILIGDAAHTIHPLAGQGANLGLRDAEQLGKQIRKLLKEKKDIGHKQFYLNYQFNRNKDTLMMLAGMQIIQDTFYGDSAPKKWIRGFGMNLIDHSSIAKKYLIKKALGI